MRLAIAQTLPATADTGLDRLAVLAGAAARAGADVLVTPEMFLSGYAVGADAVRAAAEPVDGPSAARVAALAREHDVAILYGHPEADGGRVHNAATLVRRDGTRAGGYRKTHLFGALDAAQFDASDQPPGLVEIEGWRLGILICYDVEFPEVVRGLALAGADAVLVPTANMVPFDVVNTTLVPARAVENQVYVAYANYVGVEGELHYDGQSCVVGPDGVDLARAGTDEETVLVADLDRDRLAASRRTNPYLTDRRPELYGPLTTP